GKVWREEGWDTVTTACGAGIGADEPHRAGLRRSPLGPVDGRTRYPRVVEKPITRPSAETQAQAPAQAQAQT
ncbi:hypothetical protein, partial [Streptomyces rimosus]|uniref:hypothetical protein n=1 Tax=Streptomyces rimosus TaxID=1927 RepID=UPI000A7ADF6F